MIPWIKSHVLVTVLIAGGLILMGSVTWWMDAQLTAASAAVKVAEEATKVKEEERARVEKEAIEKEKELNGKIAQSLERERIALDQRAEAQRRERAALDRLQRVITERDRQVGAIASKSDSELARSVGGLAFVTYPGESRPINVIPTAGGAQINRPALEIFNTALIDVLSQREQLQLLKDANSAMSDQVASLVIAHQAKSDEVGSLHLKLDNLGDRFSALEGVVTALGEERDALKDENKALKRKAFWGKVKTIGITVGAIVAGILIGQQI